MITALENIEKYLDKLFEIAQYLEGHDHEKAKDYVTESERWVEQCAAYAEHIQKLQHKLPLLQGGPIPPLSNPPSSSRPVINLKPVELTSDCNMSMVRAWKRQFEAYYVISNMRNLSASTQHAFLLSPFRTTSVNSRKTFQCWRLRNWLTRCCLSAAAETGFPGV